MTLPNFEAQLQKYADLIVQVGINVKKGDTVVLQITTEETELAHHIVATAYDYGAAQVLVQWKDDTIERLTLDHADEDRLAEVPDYESKQYEEWLAKKAKRISVMSSDPANLEGIDSKRIATYQTAQGKLLRPLRQATQANQVSWTVVAAAGQKWAEKVFPDLSPADAVDKLWEEIFKTCRIDQEDPIQAWRDHDQKLSAKAAELNQAQFDHLHYMAPGTDLTIGLPKNHIWYGASSKNAAGETFMANMPTEEVFTAPDYRRIDGTVVSTKPLSYAGTTLSGMSFEFKDGKVVKAFADEGNDVLQHLLDTDPGSRSLGECALVPDPSPISQSGITFYNTLFDENASDHLALGAAYAFCVADGTEMNQLQLQEAGLNQSQIHVDFMVGSNQMNIDGVTADGTIVPIFRAGDWV
ncbi:aminopeptidase pepS [Lactobacillus selangorensis]|uniref:Aminopeptidase pepS n=1 Tax=Lactobacillus selangorensis TaxID=81857 RepID=A0A0R2G3A9_9LACO|nr:aminopeptidase [Lactobacillus selangorensis]KRN28334.1 aminopeptidase pepS [Lactobacillus selangorensis]KRN31836.1 aminopeptidase pepS [Lactobacillus selangorensis]